MTAQITNKQTQNKTTQKHKIIPRQHTKNKKKMNDRTTRKQNKTMNT